MSNPDRGGWPPLSAAVLAGGQSRRMGQDKAMLPLVVGGPPLLGIVLDRLRIVSDDVFIVATDRPAYAAFGVPLHTDAFPEAGTLGGIATALLRARHPECLVVACDMPFLNPSFLAWMAAQPRTYDALVPRVPGESRQGSGMIWQTLHAIYRRSCLAAIERRLAGGERKVIGFFDDIDVRSIAVAQITHFDPDLRSFYNANTPSALAGARSILEGDPDVAIGVLDGRRLY